jgi:hypothetical protein
MRLEQRQAQEQLELVVLTPLTTLAQVRLEGGELIAEERIPGGRGEGQVGG